MGILGHAPPENFLVSRDEISQLRWSVFVPFLSKFDSHRLLYPQEGVADSVLMMLVECG